MILIGHFVLVGSPGSYGQGSIQDFELRGKL